MAPKPAPADGLERVAIIVSFPSASESEAILRLMLPSTSELIDIVSEDAVKSVSIVAVPEKLIGISIG